MKFVEYLVFASFIFCGLLAMIVPVGIIWLVYYLVTSPAVSKLLGY